MRVTYPNGSRLLPRAACYYVVGDLARGSSSLPNPRYSGMTLVAVIARSIFAAAALFGKAAWFHFGEMFSVVFPADRFSRAPVEYRRDSSAGASVARAASCSLRRGALAERPGTHRARVLRAVHAFVDDVRRNPRHRDVAEFLLEVPDRPLAQPLWGTDMAKAKGPDDVVFDFKRVRHAVVAVCLFRPLHAGHGVDQGRSPRQRFPCVRWRSSS